MNAVAPHPPPRTAADGPTRFVRIATLLMRIDTLGDLPSGAIWVRHPDGKQLHPTTTDKVPTAQLAEFIAAGRVYAIWGHDHKEFHDLVPENWSGTTLHLPVAPDQ